jgi:hypothetical protein
MALIGGFACFNLGQDDFGLFWSDDAKRIWTREKTSKYLLSYRYIPTNFEGLLMGPSYSDSFMDTRQLAGYKVYNMSMDGANATELREVALNAMERGNFRFIIICLTPYITKDHGIKGSEIHPKEYWGSLFSLLPVDILTAKWRTRANRDLNAASTWGMTEFIQRPKIPWEKFMNSEADGSNYHAALDPVAVQHLADIIQAARAKNVKIFAYSYPYNWGFTNTVDPAMWQRYEAAVHSLFDRAQDVVWDMTAPAYDPLRTDPGCYTDAHLSTAGARIVLADIKRVLDQYFEGGNRPLPFKSGEQFACYGKPGEGSGYDRPTATLKDPPGA